MSRHGLLCAVMVGAAVGCENLQDLGSHRFSGEGGVPLPGSDASTGTGMKIFFVTDGRYTGDLGGVTGADALCTSEAREAALGGTFKAWLSTSSENARDRIAKVGPWMMVDGSVVFEADPLADLPKTFLRYTAKRTDLFFDRDPNVWTATNKNGALTRPDSTCEDWSSGLAKHRGTHGELQGLQYWTDYLTIDQTSELSPCTERFRLYCFEQ